MDPSAKLLYRLKEIDVGAGIENFSDRKRLQKLAYIIQEMSNTSFNSRFSWYPHGPCSPGLTRALHLNSDYELSTCEELEGWGRQQIEKLRDFLGGDARSADGPELLVSMHYLRRLGMQYGAKKEEVIRLLGEMKPFFSDAEIKKLWAKLEAVETYREG